RPPARARQPARELLGAPDHPGARGGLDRDRTRPLAPRRADGGDEGARPRGHPRLGRALLRGALAMKIRPALWLCAALACGAPAADRAQGHVESTMSPGPGVMEHALLARVEATGPSAPAAASAVLAAPAPSAAWSDLADRFDVALNAW